MIPRQIHECVQDLKMTVCLSNNEPAVRRIEVKGAFEKYEAADVYNTNGRSEYIADEKNGTDAGNFHRFGFFRPGV